MKETLVQANDEHHDTAKIVDPSSLLIFGVDFDQSISMFGILRQLCIMTLEKNEDSAANPFFVAESLIVPFNEFYKNNTKDVLEEDDLLYCLQFLFGKYERFHLHFKDENNTGVTDKTTSITTNFSLSLGPTWDSLIHNDSFEKDEHWEFIARVHLLLDEKYVVQSGTP